jgi:hypothetical protein
MRRRAFSEFAGLANAGSRTTRLFKHLVSELERLGVCWKTTEEDPDTLGLSELASWLPFAPPDPEFARLSLSGPGGLRGFLLVHRAVLDA